MGTIQLQLTEQICGSAPLLVTVMTKWQYGIELGKQKRTCILLESVLNESTLFLILSEV